MRFFHRTTTHFTSKFSARSFSSQIVITRASEANLQSIYGWIREADWNPGHSDFESYRRFDPEGFNIIFSGVKPVGALLSTRYPEKRGFLGAFIVPPEERYQGWGPILWARGMQLVKGCHSVGLNAALAQVEKYGNSGFKSVHLNTRWSAPLLYPLTIARLENKLDLSSEVTLLEVAEMDRQITGYHRPNFWESMLDSEHSRFLSVKVKGELVGFGVSIRCVDGWKIAPLYAKDPNIAEDLLLALWKEISAKGGQQHGTLQLDTSATNAQAEILAKKHGFVKVFDTVRMYRGEKPPTLDQMQFSSASLEIGA